MREAVHPLGITLWRIFKGLHPTFYGVSSGDQTACLSIYMFDMLSMWPMLIACPNPLAALALKPRCIYKIPNGSNQ